MFDKCERIGRMVSEMEQYIYPDKTAVDGIQIKKGNFPLSEALNPDGNGWQPFRADDRWGGWEEKDRHFWFRFTVTIPEHLDGREIVCHISTGTAGSWDLANPQFLIYVGGQLVQGLDIRHQEIILTEQGRAGDTYQIALHAYCGIRGGLSELHCSLSGLDRDAERLYYDMKVPYEVLQYLDENDKRRVDMENFLIRAINLTDLRKPYSAEFTASIRAACDYLETEFYENYCADTGVSLLCVGHTHIDTAWLWTLAQTREKVARSFSTVLRLMEAYPEYVFMSSQPQLYQFLKEDHPEVYAQVKQRVAEGRWEPEGGMWVEADCNVTSGESLVRQILFGKRFFREEFGVDNEILWLPDVFGYSAALPQIMKKTGLKYFMTTKLGWNDCNGLPHDSFWWRGIDGTEVLAHMITAQSPTFMPRPFAVSYNGRIDAGHVTSSWKKYQEKDLHNEVLMAFGYGDGGGGATKWMLENARRYARGIPGCPTVKMGKSAGFFHRLEQDAAKLPKWVGELYLEFHRGTYTSMARNKRFNRKAEFLYEDAELFSVLSRDLTGAAYPQGVLTDGWRTILLNQFHDIVPGSAIEAVYEDTDRDYARVFASGSKMVDTALFGLAAQVNLENDSIVVFNQLGFVRSDVVTVELPEGLSNVAVYDGNTALSVQYFGQSMTFFAQNIPAKGYKAFTLKPAEKQETSTLYAGTDRLENDFFCIELDKNGNFTSLFDKRAGREVLPEGARGNVWQAFEDKPLDYDAWEISHYYEDKMWEITDVDSIEVLPCGPVSAGIRVKRKFLDSAICQDIVIYRDIPRIDFINRVDWKEKQILLKAAFPVDIHADKATYEIQYGSVERPTHRNTSWDKAKFEVCAQKWADLSEPGYGVSLLNDCKYGYDIHDGVMRLTLLKSAIDPNPNADREVHEFTYSLYPHIGDWRQANTPAMAYRLNCPVYAAVRPVQAGDLPAAYSYVSANRDNVMIEVVKQAEDGSGTIVRLYECHGRRENVRLTAANALQSVHECDMLEQAEAAIPADGNSFAFTIKPYEIKTFRLQ